MPQPTCSYVLERDYVDYVGGADAELVAAHTYDAAEYLLQLHPPTAPGSTPTSAVRYPRRSPITRRAISEPRTSGSRAAT